MAKPAVDDLSNLDMSKLVETDPRGSGDFGYDDPLDWTGDDDQKPAEESTPDGEVDFSTPEPEEPETPPGEETKPDDSTDPNWKVRASHYQSQNKKLADELKDARDKLGLLSKVDKLLSEDADLVDMVKAKLEGKPLDKAKSVAQVDFPTPPKEFDPFEAYNNKDSESYKYRIAYEESLVKQAAATAVAAVNSEVREKEKATAVEAESKAAKATMDAEMVKLGLSEEQQKLFWSWAASGMINGPSDAIKAWAAITGVNLKPLPKPRPAANTRPAAAKSGGSGDKETVEEPATLLESMYGKDRKSRKPKY